MASLSLKLVLTTAGIVALLVFISLGQEMNRRLQIQREVERLERDVKELEKNIIAETNLNQYFRTDAFQERMAREKLNFQAEGEQVILIPSDFEVQVPENVADDAGRELSIPRLWWNVFFGGGWGVQ